MTRPWISLLLTLPATVLLSVVAIVTSEPVQSAGATCRDRDEDGFGLHCALGEDCNDFQVTVHPGAIEACDSVDNDCNGLVDDAPACQVPAAGPARLAVPAVRFLMGSADGAAGEQPMHEVDVGSFVIDRTE